MQTRLWTWPLTASGLLQCGMMAAHIGLQYEWRGVDPGGFPPQLVWALFALNFSWTFLMGGVGALMIYTARLHPHAALVRATVLVGAIFWTVHGLYMVLEPIPLPARLAWLQGPIVTFPITLVVLQGIALFATRVRGSERAAAVV